MTAFFLTLKVIFVAVFKVVFFLLRVIRFALRLVFGTVGFYRGAFLPYGQGQRSTTFD